MTSKGSLLRFATFATLSAMCVLLTAARAAEEPAPAPEPVQAIWKDQELAFFFQSQTTFYSCGSLEAKLERIMKLLGAAAVSVKVRSVDCQSPGRIVRMPRVIVAVRAPVEATPEALAERDKDKSKRELVERVRGEKEDPQALAPFPAQWKRVSLSRGKAHLEPGDCELIDELRRKVLPKLSVRLVKDNTHCTPHQVTIGQPQLEIEALVALPKPDEKTKEK
ncbi:MAG TPA: hypothetical protein VJS12_21855 [Steroidobacteraceae bacterium]|nr:hypothetical protein [Steroidobacteraceae bacterium]